MLITKKTTAIAHSKDVVWILLEGTEFHEQLTIKESTRSSDILCESIEVSVREQHLGGNIFDLFNGPCNSDVSNGQTQIGEVHLSICSPRSASKHFSMPIMLAPPTHKNIFPTARGTATYMPKSSAERRLANFLQFLQMSTTP